MTTGRDLSLDLDIVSPADVSPEPWANGLGTTRVLAKRLGWRLSMAEIRGRMPFSALPGMDRILVPLSVPSLGLTIEGETRRATRTEGIRFAGEARVVPFSTGGTVSVINLMLHRGLAQASWSITTHRGSVEASTTAATVLLSGRASVDGLPLAPGSALLPTARARTLVCDDALVARFDIVAAPAPQ